MATSSLKKSFAINSKKEADAFVKMFADSPDKTQKPLEDVNFSILSKDEIKKIISANVKKS